MLRAALVAGAALGASACANQPVLTGGDQVRSLSPIMLVGGPAFARPAEQQSIADRLPELRRKSMAAKVLTARALESVTGLKPDPARLSEHD